MKREQFEEILKADGWERDRFGHYHKAVRKRIPMLITPRGSFPSASTGLRCRT